MTLIAPCATRAGLLNAPMTRVDARRKRGRDPGRRGEDDGMPDKKVELFDYQDLLACGRGELFGPGNAQLPAPPMLMMDRITRDLRRPAARMTLGRDGRGARS